MQKKHLCHLPKRAVCGALALLMIVSTALTGCGSQGITTHALEDDHNHAVVETVSDETVSLRETLADSLDADLAKQAAEIGSVYWENDVPANEDAVKNEYNINEGETDVPEIEIGSSVELSNAEATTVEKKFDDNGLRETAFELKVMYTTVDADYLDAGSVTEMWNENYEAFIANYNMMQHLYEVEGMDDVYVAFVNFSALNGTDGKIVSADFTRGTERHPIDMESQVVLDKENGVLYVPKAWYFAGDGTEVGLDLAAQIMVAVDIHNEQMTDANGNLLANVSVTVENESGADIILQNGQYSMIAYDYAILPLFTPGSISDLDSDEIEVYINGSAEPLKAEDLGYSVAEGKLTIRKVAMTLTEVKVVMKGRTILQSMANFFSIGDANAASLITDHPGMVPMYNVTTGEELNPDIDIDSLTVGDVLAYETIGNYGSRYTDVFEHMWSNGCSNFVYTSNWAGGTSRSDTYWSFVGNKNIDTDNMEYSLGSKDSYGFIIELPFSSPNKKVPDPVIIKSASSKLTLGSTVHFGEQDDWKWTNEVYNAGEVMYNYAIPGQCSHTDDSTYLSGQLSFTNKNSGVGNRKPYNSTVTNTEGQRWDNVAGITWYSARNANGWYKSSPNGVPVNYVTLYWQWGDIETKQQTNTDTKFRCDCTCAACDSYRKNNFLGGGETPDYCDNNCPTCSSGKCNDCRTDWIKGVSAVNAQATCRVLVIADDYMILGFAQLDSGDCQRGSCVLKVRTSVRLGVHKNSYSTLNGGTIDNECYADLSDSEYSVYKDPECTQFVGKVRGDGVDYIRVRRGTYYIKETKAPVGYYIDTEKHIPQADAGNVTTTFTDNLGFEYEMTVPKATIYDGVHEETITKNTWYEYSDEPMQDPIIIAVQKNVSDRDTAGITTGDVGFLEGIEFDVYYYKGEYKSLEALNGVTADEHAVFQTDEDGLLLIDDDHIVKPHTWQYRSDVGAMLFPMGTVLVKEKSSIDGLLIYNDAGMLFTLTDLSDKTSANVRINNFSNASGNGVMGYHGTISTLLGSSHKELTEDRVSGSYENISVKGGLTVWKADTDWEKSDYQGDATLAGAEFTIYNRSETSVYYKGNIYEPNEAIGTIVTAYDSSAKGYVATTGTYALEYGTYEVKETKAPTGYNMSEWSRTFEIREDGQMHFYMRTNEEDIVNGLNWLHRWCVDPVMRGGVAFGKVDRETKQYFSLGASSLAGATFELYNRSEHPVYVDGVTYAVDEKIMDFVSEEMDITMETGIEGYTKTIIGNTTGNYVLPYGTYEIIETGTGIGYLYDSNSKAQSKVFSIRSEGDMHYFTDELDAFHNKVQREDWYFSKKADDSGHEMVNVAWTATSVTTGETHIIVTDENGKYQSDQVAHSQRTNANDPDSPISNGAVAIDENGDYYVADASKLDYDAGTWFTGVNPEYVTWAEDGQSYTVNLGVKDIYGNVYESTGIVDDTLRAYPYDTYLIQELPSEANQGYNLVNFLVTLKRYNSDPDSNGIILDYGTVDDQRVDIFTHLGYTPTKFSNIVKFIPSETEAEIIDVITYSGLTEGSEYVMKGEIHLLDEDGNDTGVIATNEMTFTAKAAGQLKMPFTVDTTGRYEQVMVATEAIYQDGTLLTEETDLTNIDQSVIVQDVAESGPVEKAIEIDTYAVNAANNSKELAAAADQSVFECVKLSYLKAGKTYKLEGSIYYIDDKGNARAIRDEENNPLTVTIENPEDEVTMTFTGIDASKFGGHDIVVYQNLYELVGEDDWKIVASHTDKEDTDQTVRVPAISGTPAGDPDDYPEFKDMPEGGTVLLGGTNIHNDQVGNVVLIDKVACVNLTPGQKYVVNGTLHFREDTEVEDGYEAVDMGVLEGVTGSTEFTADDRNMIVDVVFTFDASELEGKVVVAYEELYAYAEAAAVADEWAAYFTAPMDDSEGNESGLVLVASHADINDAAESVGFGRINATTLTTSQGLHEGSASGDVLFTDVVEYEGLIPGEVYTINGILYVQGNDALSDVEDLLENIPLIVKNDNIGDWFTKVKAWADESNETEISTVAGNGITAAAEENAEEVVKDRAMLISMLNDWNELHNADRSIVATAEKTFVPETPNGTVNVEFAFNADGLDGKTVVAVETITCNGEFVAAHDDMEDEMQSVHFIGIDTVLTGMTAAADDTNEAENEGDTTGETTEAADDTNESDNEPSNAEVLDNLANGVSTQADDGYAVTDEEFQKIQDLIDRGNRTSIDEEGRSELSKWVGDVQAWANGLADRTYEEQATAIAVECGYCATAMGDKNYENIVKYRSSIIDMLLNYSRVAYGSETTDTPDEGNTQAPVADGEPIKTVKFKVYSGAQEIFGISQLQAESFQLKDTVVLTNLTPGTEYTLVSEAHLRTQVGNAKVDMGNLNFNETKTFTAEAAEETIEVTFTINPLGIQEADIIAYQYLYQGENLVASHADINDDDQAVHVIGELQQKPIDGEKPDKNPCGCDDPECKHKDEVDHCVNNPGCCDDSDCCNTCDTCKGKNPCGCDDPDCKHKDEVDHCKNNPGCCDDSDCCKDCDDCKHNLCGCDDPDCKHKDEKDHCKNNPGCCDDSDCCKDCDECMPKNPCGCDDPNCKHKDEKDHCKTPGCCDDSDCCKGCDDCKPKNPCGCDDPDCKHKNEKDHCKTPGCCDDSDCCKDCDECQPKNPCGCDDPNCKHKNEKDHCKNNPGCCDDADCCKDCDECQPKNPCGCSDPDCKHKNEKNHCVNNPGCCDDSDCCKKCDDCKAKNLCGCDDANCKHKNEKNHCVNNPGCCDDSSCCKDCKTCTSKNLCGCDDADCKHKNEKNHCVNNPGCCSDSDCCKKCSTCKDKAATTTKTDTTTKNPVKNVIEAVKTGESDFLLFSLIGLVVLAGGGFLFFGKTDKGRELLAKLREKFRK